MQEADAFNAGEALLARAAARGDSAVYRCAGRSLAAAELVRRALAFQRGLAAAGIEPGERVLLVLRDTPAFPVAFLGALRAGVIPIPISTLLPAADVAFIAADARAAAAFVDEALAPALDDAFPAALRPVRVRDACFDGFAAAGPAHGEPAAAPTRAGDVAFWLYTSGTTGQPKGVLHRHADLPATAEHYARGVLGMHAGDRVFSAAKLFFAYGLGNGLCFPLWLGAEAVLHPERATPEAVFAVIARERPTLFFGVPTLYASMLAHPALPASLGPLRLCVSAGEALAPALLARFQDRFGVELLDGLGSTEMLHIFVSNRPGAVRPGSAGTPVPGYAVRVVDEAGRDVPDGEVGTLLAHGPSAAPGYWRRPEQTATTMFAPGWLRSGDSARRDAEGFLYLEGRTDDLLKVGGIFVSPVEVEAVLQEHPAVAEVAVVGRADAHGLVKPCAFVVAKPGAPAGDELARALQQLARARLAPYKYPRWIELRDALPKTATGKIRRHALRGDATPRTPQEPERNPMSKQIVSPPNMAPTSGYSYAIKKSGTPLFISGQVALDAQGKIVGEGDAAAQTEQVFRNLRSVVEAAGGSLDDIVKINVYVTDPSYRPAVAAARERHFESGRWPASTYVVVSALAVPQLLVEVEAVAMIE